MESSSVSTLDAVRSTAQKLDITPAMLVSSFLDNLRRLFYLLTNLNQYIADVRGTPQSPPVPSFIISLAKLRLEATTPEAAHKLAYLFAERSWPCYDHIIVSKNLHHFSEVAENLFPEMPKGIIAVIVSIATSPELPSESISDIFGLVETLFWSVMNLVTLESNGTVPIHFLEQHSEELQRYLKHNVE